MPDCNHYAGESDLNWIKINKIAYEHDKKCEACKKPSSSKTCLDCIGGKT